MALDNIAARDDNRVTVLMGTDINTIISTRTPVAVGVDTLTHRLLVSAIITSGGGGSSSIGTTAINTGQVALSTGASIAVAARSDRRSVTIVNLSSIDIYIGGSSGVTSSNGQLLLGTKGTALTIETIAVIYAIAATGTPSISYLEEYA